jgi:hypothetical protein
MNKIDKSKSIENPYNFRGLVDNISKLGMNPKDSHVYSNDEACTTFDPFGVVHNGG